MALNDLVETLPGQAMAPEVQKQRLFGPAPRQFRATRKKVALQCVDRLAPEWNYPFLAALPRARSIPS